MLCCAGEWLRAVIFAADIYSLGARREWMAKMLWIGPRRPACLPRIEDEIHVNVPAILYLITGCALYKYYCYFIICIEYHISYL